MKIKKGKEKDYEEFVNNECYAVINYMSKWVDLMENKIENNDPQMIIDKYAEELSHEAGNTTGFVYGRVVQALNDFWEYGDILRAWHNKMWGYEGEDSGVLITAIQQ